MRLVLDTNTAVSGLIWGGMPGRLIDAAAAGKARIIGSVELLDELQGVLKDSPANGTSATMSGS